MCLYNKFRIGPYQIACDFLTKSSRKKFNQSLISNEFSTTNELSFNSLCNYDRLLEY